MLLLLLLTMVGRGREEGGCSGGARKGTGPKPKMDAASIAKREKKAARKTAKESLAAFTERETHARHAANRFAEAHGIARDAHAHRQQQPVQRAG